MTEQQFALLEQFARRGYSTMSGSEQHRVRVTVLEAIELARAGQRLRATKAGMQRRFEHKRRLARLFEAALVPPSAKEPVAEMPPEYWPTQGTG